MNSTAPNPTGFPDADELAMLRAWYAGMPVRKTVERYLPDRVGAGQSARGVLGGVRRRLVRIARQVGRPDLLDVFTHPDGERLQKAKAVADAIEQLRHARAPVPQISDDIGLWLPTRAVSVLRATASRRSPISPCGFPGGASGGKRLPASARPAPGVSRPSSPDIRP